jgi:hypothetical protein
VVIVPLPDLQLRVYDQEEQNRAELEDRCKGWPDRYLADSGNPTKLLVGKGYVPISPSGVVSEVRWDTQQVLTRATLLNWWAPAGALAGGAKFLRELEEGGDYPNQAKTESDRAALGAVGTGKAVAPINPWRAEACRSTMPGSPRSRRPTPCTAASTGEPVDGTGRNAVADATAGQGRAAVDARGADGEHQRDVDADPLQHDGERPRGQLPPRRAVRADPPHRLRQGAKRKYVLATCVPSFEHFFWVDLVQDGGADAVWSGDTFTSPVSYTYTAILQGDCCTADGDCATASAAPATPTDTPACCPSSCGCTNGLPRFASVNITGSACCTSCYAPPTELASAKVIGANFDGTWTLARQTNLCAYRAVVNAGTLFKLDCWDRDCSGTNGPIDEYPCVAIVLAKSSSTPNTWRLTFAPHDADALGNCVDSGSALGTFYFDSGFFIWNDADSCAGTATTTGNIFAACGFRDTGSDCDIPDNIGTGGTATIQLDF